MIKWLKFFWLGFFSHKHSKLGGKRGYSNFLLAFILAIGLLWGGCVGTELVPFSAHYNNATDFKESIHLVFANADVNKRIDAEIENGVLKAKKHGGDYGNGLLINTFENEIDKQKYSVNGYHVVVDSRPADTLAEFEAYCVSIDGQDVKISYEEYLNLDVVLKMKFEFKLRYTGNSFELTDELVEEYKKYVDGLSVEKQLETTELKYELSQNTITKSEYNRAIYELYFENYYPEITEYESESKVPLLRNYYYHEYISKGISNYILIFDDYMAGSFETNGGIAVTFYGFYSDLENGALISDGATQNEANKEADNFIKKSFAAITPLILYAYVMNIVSMIPFIALMPMVVSLLAYSILKLRGVESISSFGSMFKIVGSFMWFSAAITAIVSIIASFFVPRNIIAILPLVVYFITLAIRSMVFAVKETKLYKQLEQQESEIEEV